MRYTIYRQIGDEYDDIAYFEGVFTRDKLISMATPYITDDLAKRAKYGKSSAKEALINSVEELDNEFIKLKASFGFADGYTTDNYLISLGIEIENSKLSKPICENRLYKLFKVGNDGELDRVASLMSYTFDGAFAYFREYILNRNLFNTLTINHPRLINNNVWSILVLFEEVGHKNEVYLVYKV